MMHTLYSKLALTLFIILSLIGVSLIQIISQSSSDYQQEVEQKLNHELASHIIQEYPLIKQRKVNQQALDKLFHQLMVINPNIELYLLDEVGKILGFSAKKDKVKRDRVKLEPLMQYLEGDHQFPLKGDDPRNPTGSKVFSVARIIEEDKTQGYLYIVLGGELYDHAAEMIGSSYTFQVTLAVVLVALLSALFIGLATFAVQTRRLLKLGKLMQAYSTDQHQHLDRERYPWHSQDEIDVLGTQFNTMADKIDAQIEEMRQMDEIRREMVANISHDLRTPLTTMRGYLETLDIKGDKLSKGEQHQYLETALRYSERLGRMVEELFELAQLDSIETIVYSEAFSISELVQDVIQKFHLRAEKKSIHIKSGLKPCLPSVYGDIAMMQRVLENLIENALRHTPAGGEIMIRVDESSGNLNVSVSDSGCGIPLADIPRIFERFYQQDKQRTSGGAGLGLAIVKRILELHGSFIEVKSKLEQGTTFSFSLSAKPIVMNS